MKRNAKSAKLKVLAVVLYIVILCVLVTGTLAWFIFDKTVTIKNNGDMQIMAGSRLEISMDGGETWGSNYSIDTGHVSFPDITGNGKNFLFPMFLDSDDKTIMDDPETFRVIDSSNEDAYCITLRIKFRTSANTGIYLSNQSYVKAKNLTVSDVNRSLYGDISRDAIAGAVRVSFSEEVSDQNGVPMEEVKNVWIPNDNLRLYYDNENRAKLAESGPREESFGYQFLNGDGAVENYTYTGEDYSSRQVTVGGEQVLASLTEGAGATAMIHQSQELLTFSNEISDAGQESEGSDAAQAKDLVQEKTLVVRIWIEGTDREADKALVGGEMDYKLHFVCIDKSENPNTDKLDAIELNEGTLSIPGDSENLVAKTEYSFNGIDWTPYGSTINVNNRQNLYVRFAETTGHKASPVKVISLVETPDQE